eukprot:TRINITY_DN1196_c0_g1_i1.p1 TRINITY_DN1196_c0_g1~~TRINITY_DN1196_c0_g1_i1.p1  ORF type:complete len:560 (+),score=52.72 TRINITY_DN1196_c0_g1_i1:130-1809(+)
MRYGAAKKPTATASSGVKQIVGKTANSQGVAKAKLHTDKLTQNVNEETKVRPKDKDAHLYSKSKDTNKDMKSIPHRGSLPSIAYQKGGELRPKAKNEEEKKIVASTMKVGSNMSKGQKDGVKQTQGSSSGKPVSNLGTKAVSKPALSQQESSKSNTYKSLLPFIKKPKIESIISKAPTNKNLATLCDFFKAQSTGLSEEEKAWLVFRWIALNIAYDAAGFLSGRRGDMSPEGVLKFGKAVCSGYAKLYQHIALQLGLETECISGYAKGVGYNVGTSFESTNHEWNAIKLRGTWYLIDSTWGAGHLDGSTFKKEYNEYYFCTDPHNLIRSHYPKDSKWQLIQPPISKEKFESLIKFYEFFYECGLVAADPDKAALTSEGVSKFKLYFKPNAGISLMAGLNYLNGSTLTPIEGGAFIQKCADHYEIDALFNKAGKYKLYFYANTKGVQNYLPVVEYTVTCATSGKAMGKFPTQYPGFNDINAIVHSPKTGPLKVGTSVLFRLQIEKAEEVMVVVGSQFTDLKKVKGVFEGEVKVVSGEVMVSYKCSGLASYITILSYDTIT